MENEIRKNPIKTFNCGAVKAAIWLNFLEQDGALVEIHSIKINKSYKDKDDNNWKHTDNLCAEDLLKVAVVANEAYKYIRMRSSEDDKC